MTKQMKPLEFKQYIAHNKPKQVKFGSDDQRWFDPLGVAPTYCLSFPCIDVGVSPPDIRIFDSTGANFVRFEGVKYISVEKVVPDALRVKFRIFCESPLRESTPASREFVVWAE